MKPTREDLQARLVKARAVLAAKHARMKVGREVRPAEPAAQASTGFNIVEMVTSPKYLGDTAISVGQIAILKAIYGLVMTPDEMAEFLLMSEGRPPRPGGYSEATVIAGTGSGKTDKLLANIMVFEAITFDTRKLSPGETAVVPLVAQDEKAAGIALDYIEGKLRILQERGFNVLQGGAKGASGPRQKDVVGGEIRVYHNVVIRVFPCKKASTRGVSAIAAGMDEFAHWRTEPNAYNSDREIQRAIKGRRRAHTPFLRLVKITSPYGEEGVAYEDYEERHKARRLFVQAPTWVLNPALSRESLADEELDDPDAFARERGAQFGKVGGNFLPGELVESCMVPGRDVRLEPRAVVTYLAALDVAFKVDQYVLGIGHLEDGPPPRVVVDGLWMWQGSRQRPLDDAATALEVSEILRAYDLDVVVGDQFADVPTKREYKELGIRFVMEPQTAQTNFQMYRNLKAGLRRRQVELPPDMELKKQLTGLVRSKLQGGLYRVAAPERAGSHDDMAKVVAILSWKLLPIADKGDLDEMNKGAVGDRDRLFRERGFPVPESDERLPSEFMSEVF